MITITAITMGSTTGFRAIPDAAERCAPARSASLFSILVGFFNAAGPTQAVMKCHTCGILTRALDQVESTVPAPLMTAIRHRGGVMEELVYNALLATPEQSLCC